MSQDTTHSIQNSAVRFFSGTLLSRLTGWLRDMALAFAFGTAAPIAAFMTSFRFAHLARRLFGEGSLQNTFIPEFEELRHQDEKRAFAFFRDLKATLALFLLLLISLGMSLLALISHTLSLGETTQLLLNLTLWMLPSLLFICLFGLNAALLECEKSYFVPSIAPVAFNLVWIGAALLLSSLSPEKAVYFLSLAVIVACFFQWAFTLPSVSNILDRKGISYALSDIKPFSKDVRQLIKPLFLANIGIAASQINNAIDPLFALGANLEGPAWLWYAMRVQQLPIALFGVALSGALLPPLSRAIKKGNLEQFDLFFDYAKTRIAALTIPLTFSIFAIAPTAINFLFGRGRFDLESVGGSSLCLVGYGVALFPMAFILIGAPALYGFKDFRTPTRGALYSMLLNIILNALAILVFGLGVPSVALATSFAAFWNAFYLNRALNLKRGRRSPLLIDKKNGPLLGISLLAMGASFAVDFFFIGEVPTLQILQGYPLSLEQNFPMQFYTLGLETATFAATLLFGAYLFDVKEILVWKTKEPYIGS